MLYRNRHTLCIFFIHHHLHDPFAYSPISVFGVFSINSKYDVRVCFISINDIPLQSKGGNDIFHLLFFTSSRLHALELDISVSAHYNDLDLLLLSGLGEYHLQEHTHYLLICQIGSNSFSNWLAIFSIEIADGIFVEALTEVNNDNSEWYATYKSR